MVWPFIVSAGQDALEDDNERDFPLASIPSAGKMARMLGSEIAVFKPDAGGLLMKSRGKIPLITKLIPGYTIMGGGLFFMMMR
ncbi:MAG: hypothetical protein QGG25_05145 [Phycisphaerae bacterium]|jgi:hypothetical protein|nr:hypothetical protein [Phycisphaerae bacterium]